MSHKSLFLTFSGFALLNLGIYLLASHLKHQVVLIGLAWNSLSLDVAGFVELLIDLQSLGVASLFVLISTYLVLRFGVSLLLLGCSGRGRL